MKQYSPLSPMEREILALLVSGWTTPMEALRKAGSFSLSQRVGSLIRQGFSIEKGWHVTKSGSRVRKYRVKECK